MVDANPGWLSVEVEEASRARVNELRPSMTSPSSPVPLLAAALALIAGAPSPANVHVQPEAPQAASSYTLIGQAPAAGRIDQETAYKYRVFAAFGD